MLEKRKLESLFGMGSGYVLNFSNRTFAEFFHETVGRNIYDSAYSYGSGSKANKMRAFWQKEDNRVVGTLLNEMLEYCAGTTEQEAVLKEDCRRIVARLLGRPLTPAAPEPASQKEADTSARRQSETLQQLKEEFFRLAAESNRNKAGLALEPLLNKLFDLFGLSPREPFRVVGEQIDGSFILDGQVYLLESKWEKNPLPEADLLVFRGKIEGKSTFTRGVMIALNDVSAPAREAITRGKAPSFFVMNGHDLMMVLSEAMSLTEFLRKRVRMLAEKGYVCVPFSELV
jgi:hypothetical protein